jgi:two-component system chemotaxis response regulator CheY
MPTVGDRELTSAWSPATEHSPRSRFAPEVGYSPEPQRVEIAPAKKILVVDDDPNIRELVAITVSNAGFWADTAQDGEEGWQAICMTAYDLIITDHEMPRLTGLSLIKRLRKVSPEPPCILISGNLPDHESALVGIIHSSAFLPKPFSPSALIEKVYGILLYGDFPAF